jgi:hypothetical protein
MMNYRSVLYELDLRVSEKDVESNHLWKDIGRRMKESFYPV